MSSDTPNGAKPNRILRLRAIKSPGRGGVKAVLRLVAVVHALTR